MRRAIVPAVGVHRVRLVYASPVCPAADGYFTGGTPPVVMASLAAGSSPSIW
jgi:hypothetical protein